MIKYLCLRYNMRAAIAITQPTGFGNDALFSAMFHKMNSSTYFRSHGTFGEMTFLKVLFGLGNRDYIQRLFAWFTEIDIYFGHIG